MNTRLKRLIIDTEDRLISKASQGYEWDDGELAAAVGCLRMRRGGRGKSLIYAHLLARVSESKLSIGEKIERAEELGNIFEYFT